jgi:hypothetical protein
VWSSTADRSSSTPLVIAYPCEIWPYRLRSRGLTITNVTTVVAIFFNTFVNPIALVAIGWKYYSVFIVVIVVMFFTVYFVYPETRGKHSHPHVSRYPCLTVSQVTLSNKWRSFSTDLRLYHPLQRLRSGARTLSPRSRQMLVHTMRLFSDLRLLRLGWPCLSMIC